MMKRMARDPSLWLRGRVVLSGMGVRAIYFNAYRRFLYSADRVKRTPGVPMDDKIVLLLRTRVAQAADKQGLDRKVLVELLFNVLNVQVDE